MRITNKFENHSLGRLGIIIDFKSPTYQPTSPHGTQRQQEGQHPQLQHQHPSEYHDSTIRNDGPGPAVTTSHRRPNHQPLAKHPRSKSHPPDQPVPAESKSRIVGAWLGLSGRSRWSRDRSRRGSGSGSGRLDAYSLRLASQTRSSEAT